MYTIYVLENRILVSQFPSESDLKRLLTNRRAVFTSKNNATFCGLSYVTLIIKAAIL